MTRVTVYQCMLLDPKRIEKRKSRHWRTREGIESLKDFGEILEDTELRLATLSVGGVTAARIDRLNQGGVL